MRDSKIEATGVTGGVRWILRLEGLLALGVALFFYTQSGFSWRTFALFFFVPDLSLLAYFAGARVGALCYNAAHSYTGALICLVAASFFGVPTLLCTALIWGAHIGFDRALGYGLKYAAGFRFTHLGRLGKEDKQSEVL